MFSLSPAAASLQGAVRSLAPMHGARLSLHLSRALSTQLTASLACVEVCLLSLRAFSRMRMQCTALHTALHPYMDALGAPS